MPRVGLFGAQAFTGFGASRFLPDGETPDRHEVRTRSAKKLREGVRASAPQLPGVYAMRDARGRIVYVGKAKRLRTRLLSYFRKDREHKAGKIIARTHSLVWEQTPDEFSALLRELELIQRFRPRFNVVGQPGRRRYVYLVVGKGPAPTVAIVREPSKKERVVFGPLVGRGSLDEAVRRLNDHFRLRDCPSTIPIRFREQGELFESNSGAACLRYELSICSGPCAGFCTSRDYAKSVRGVKEFLEGKDTALLPRLEEQMREAARDFQYERAAALRDKWSALTALDRRLTFLRDARRGSTSIYCAGAIWYLIHRGDIRATVRAPTTPAAERELRKRFEKWIETPLPIREGGVDSILLVSAWFRKWDAERAKLVEL